MNDYKASFAAEVDKLVSKGTIVVVELNHAIAALTDSYINAYGKWPESEQLDRLADCYMYEIFSDRHPDKVTRNEYPILSHVQLQRRRDREYSLGLAEHYDEDGRNRAKPTRRRRTAREERFVDKASRRRNRERNAQYRKDTSPGDVVSYNLQENGGELTEPFVDSKGVGQTWRDRLSSVYSVVS